MPSDSLRILFMPYCMKRVVGDQYEFLNRNYEPLRRGIHRVVGLTPDKAEQISWNGSRDLDTLYLYNDGCIPSKNLAYMKAYKERLEAFLDLCCN